MMIPLSEYARRHDRQVATMIQRATRGAFETAQKVGKTWLIDEDEPLVDNRIRTGKYIGFRENLGKGKRSPGDK